MTPFMLDDRYRDECGVFGISAHPEAAQMTYFGLYALQHRGQESAGISVARDGDIFSHKEMGLVPDIFDTPLLKTLGEGSAIGHVRYSTAGASTIHNAQPFVVRHRQRAYALAHNGNLVNAHLLKHELEESGSIFQTTMDSEIFLHLFIKHLKIGFDEALLKSVEKLRGAFSFVMLTSNGEIIGIKDSSGIRPLCLGKLSTGQYVLSSESCALDLISAEFVRELEPGEIVIIDKNGIRSLFNPIKRKQAFCIFELIYFARPDSTINGKNVYLTRKAHGRQLAIESPIEADFVMPFPDSGNYAAIGFAQQIDLPFEMGMIRNHYVGRTFIQPTQSMRDFSVEMKLNPAKELLRGKEVIIVEDSIVRGTTTRTRVKVLRELGVKKIHMRVSAPTHCFPCHYGIDFSSKGELIAAKYSVPELTDVLGLDSLRYLSIEGMLKATGSKPESNIYCTACFDGNYPIPFDGSIF